MEVLILHILKLNIIAAVVILLVKVLATLFKGRVSARWKYFIFSDYYTLPTLLTARSSVPSMEVITFCPAS